MIRKYLNVVQFEIGLTIFLVTIVSRITVEVFPEYEEKGTNKIVIYSVEIEKTIHVS